MKEIVIVASKIDPAGLSIAESLIDMYGFERSSKEFEGNRIFERDSLLVVFSERDIIHVDGLDQDFSPSLYVFASRHRSESGIPSLTAHFTGNFAEEAAFGGLPKELSYTYPSFLKEYMRRISQNSRELAKYHVVLEPTHHGPTSLGSPVLFVELGSTEKEWRDKEASAVIGRTIMETLASEPHYPSVGIGFGGTHYSTKFTNYLLNSDMALASVAPKYVLDNIDLAMVKQMIQKSVEKVTYAVLEWKSLGPLKERIVGLANGSGLKITKI